MTSQGGFFAHIRDLNVIIAVVADSPAPNGTSYLGHKAETVAATKQGPLLLIWFNFNPSMDKKFYPSKNVGWHYLSIPERGHRCSRRFSTL